MQDKGELKTNKTEGWDWSQWDSPFYKKQNELIMADLEKDGPHFMFPTYTHGELKKKPSKGPGLKPGDDWWIEL